MNAKTVEETISKLWVTLDAYTRMGWFEKAKIPAEQWDLGTWEQLTPDMRTKLLNIITKEVERAKTKKATKKN